MTVFAIVTGLWAAMGIGLAVGTVARFRLDPAKFAAFQNVVEERTKWRPDLVGAAVAIFLFAPFVLAVFIARALRR